MEEDLRNWTGREPVTVPTLYGKFVSIRPYGGRDDGRALWRAFGGAGANHLMRYFPTPEHADAEDFAKFLDGEQGKLATAIYRDPATGTVMGMASYLRNDAANGVVEIGAIAHGTSMARKAAATEAEYLLARHVFDTLGYRRYEWKCDDANSASKRAAFRLGFKYEGLFRQHMVSRGRNRDTAWFAIIDGEWPVLRRAFEAWLDPVNFDAHGRQKLRLEDIRISFTGT